MQKRAGAPAVLAVAFATFTVVTAEMLPVGLLTPLADGLGIGEGTAGLTMTLPGLTAAAAAPLVVRFTRRADRGRVLWTLMLLLAAANLAAAWSPSFGVLLAARVVTGVSIGGVWAVAVTLAPRLVAAPAAARANALVFSGIAAASVLGVPLGTRLGDLAGWRSAFLAGAVLAVLVAGALALLLPPLPPVPAAGGGRAYGLPKALLVVAALVAGHFAAYTYVRPLLEDAGLGAAAIGALLLGYGLAGVAGNFLVGLRSAAAPTPTLIAIVIALGLVLAAAPLARGPLAATALLLAWGLAYGGVSVGTQTWVFAVVPGARETVSAAYTSVFNLAIATGALVGGAAAEAAGVPWAVWLGAGLIALSGAVLRFTPGRATPPEAAPTPAAPRRSAHR